VTLPLHIDRSSDVSLQDQLFHQLRDLILSGKLAANTRVIGTRFLAEQCGVSRTTVLITYERLISEGYLETRPTVGTFVSDKAPKLDPNRTRAGATTAAATELRQATTHPGVIQPQARTAPTPSSTIDFRSESPKPEYGLSGKEWLNRIRALFAHDSDLLNREQPVIGLPSLRLALSDYLAATRGVRASPEQIIVVSGRRQACNLVSHLVLRRGERAVLESPGDPSVRAFFEARGAQIECVEVDEFGLVTSQLPSGPASLAYVTPARQNPIGGTLSYARRRELLAWARASGAYIIEEDCDSDFRYGAMPPPALAALDTHGLVFHIGSFQRSLGSGFSIGYVVAPEEFVASAAAIQAMSDGMTGVLEQAVLAGLLADGGYDRHLNRLRKLYRERRDNLIGALSSNFGDVQLVGQDLGLQLTWLLPEAGPAAGLVARQAWAQGVHVEPVLGESRASRFRDRALILRYAALGPDELRRGVGRLAGALTRCSNCLFLQGPAACHGSDDCVAAV
jgi:GntR family transcriptional regulator/MocR family aminotransferase